MESLRSNSGTRPTRTRNHRSGKNAGATLAGSLAMFFLYAGSIPSDTPVGPTSLAGILTGAIAGLSLVLFPWLLVLRERRAASGHTAWTRWLPLTWWLFLLWAALSLLRLFTVDGAQNIAVWFCFSFVACAGTLTANPEAIAWLLRQIPRAAWITTAVYTATVIIDGLGTNLIFGARAYAWTALIFIAVMVAAPQKTKGSILLPAVLVFAIGLTLSRTALALSLILLVGMVMRGKKGGRAVKASMILGGAAYAGWTLINTYEPLRQRFFEGDDALRIGDVALNTSGRIAFWEKVWDSAMIDPFLGRGLGSSVTVTSRYYASYGTTQPHNDYLRLLHDLGWIGAILFTVALLAILGGAISRARLSEDPVSRQIHVAVILVMGVILTGMITDNLIVYPFIMIPIAYLIGLSTAAVKMQDSEAVAGGVQMSSTSSHV